MRTRRMKGFLRLVSAGCAARSSAKVEIGWARALAVPPGKEGGKLARSLDGDELGASGGTVADLTVANGLVGHGVLSEVVADHVSFDFNRVPVLAGVDLSDGTDHLGHDDAVAQVSLDGLGLLAVGGVLDGLGELLDQTVIAGEDAASETSSLSRPEHGDHLRGADLKELVELDASVNLLFEWFFFGLSSSLGSRKFFLDRGHI